MGLEALGGLWGAQTLALGFQEGAEGPGGRSIQELAETFRASRGAPMGPESRCGERRGFLEAFSENSQ